MKKFLYIPVALALVAPLATCTNKLSATASTVVPTTPYDAAPTTKSTSTASFAALTSDWYHYRATDDSYSALFPGKPSESIGSNSSVQVTYEDRANNRAYLTQSSKLAPNASQVEVEKVLDGAVASQSHIGDISSLEKISLNGMPGREIIVRNKQGFAIKARMFINPKAPAVYVVAVGAENGNLDFPESQAFLDSISIP
jgi:hypothetical protein